MTVMPVPFALYTQLQMETVSTQFLLEMYPLIRMLSELWVPVLWRKQSCVPYRPLNRRTAFLLPPSSVCVNKSVICETLTLAPAAVACDIFLVRRSAHPRGAFLYIRKEHFPNI